MNPMYKKFVHWIHCRSKICVLTAGNTDHVLESVLKMENQRIKRDNTIKEMTELFNMPE